MPERRIETMKGMCAVDITKFIMKELNLSCDEAYAKFMQMELFRILMDTESGMYLEQNEFLYKCCKAELELGEEGLYQVINAA